MKRLELTDEQKSDIVEQIKFQLETCREIFGNPDPNDIASFDDVYSHYISKWIYGIIEHDVFVDK